MGLYSSLNRNVLWSQLLPLMGITVKGAVLPAIVQCPLCQKKGLRIYHDPVWDGQWSSCRECRFHGDMIELSACVWKLNIGAACRKLEKSGFTLSDEMPLKEAIQWYQTKFLDVREKTKQFWSDCQQHFAYSCDPEMRELRSKIGATTANLGAQWKYHGSQILGSCHYSTVDFAYNNNGNDRLTGRRGSCNFIGRDWGNVLVMPFWSMPDRISGFLCMGRNLNPVQDFVFIPVREGKRNVPGRQAASEDGGIGMLPAMFGPRHPDIGNNLLITNDPLMALQLQLKWLQSFAQLLPILSIADFKNGETKAGVWNWIPKSSLVFWSPDNDPTMLKHASHTNSRFTNYAVRLPTFNEGRGLHIPKHALTLFSSLLACAKPWDSALRDLMEDMDEPAIEEVILEMELNGPALREFIDNSLGRTRDKLTSIYTSRARAKQVHYGTATVTEEADGWYVKGHRISSAIVRIDQLLQSRAGRNYYRGVILFNGEQIPFTERTSNMKSNLLRWASDYLEMTGRAGMVYLTSWGSKALNVALSFQQPKVVTGVDVVGWDAERMQFNFPKFAIQMGGDVLHDYACLFNDKNVPGQELEPPTPLSKKEVNTLSTGDEETGVVWAVAGCIAANVVAPAIQYDTNGLILDGSGAHSVGRAATFACGCPEYGSAEYRLAVSRRLSRMGDKANQHNWPFLVDAATADLSAMDTWLASDQAKQVILPLSWGSARVMGTRGWNILRCERVLGAMQLPAAAAARVLPNYLRDLCTRRLFINNISENHIENIIRDMAAWFAESCGGDHSAVIAALDLLELSGVYPLHRHFLDIVFRYVHDGRLPLIRESFEEYPVGEGVVYNVSKEAAIWIPEEKVLSLLERDTKGSPTTLAVTRSIDAAGGLIDQPTYQNKRGWLVTEEWWTEEHAEWKKQTAKIGGPIL